MDDQNVAVPRRARFDSCDDQIVAVPRRARFDSCDDPNGGALKICRAEQQRESALVCQ